MQPASYMLSMNDLPFAGKGGAMQQERLLKKQPLTDTEGPAPPSFEDFLTAVGKKRDRQAFIHLFEYYAPRIKGFFIKGGLNHDTADELAQETMLTVWNRAMTYDPALSSASTWIYTIARNKRIDYFRKRGRPEPDRNDPLMIPDAPLSADLAINQTQENDILAAAIEDLPAEQAEIIRKSYFEDKTHADIAAETGLPLGTVKSRIRLALERLRHHLGETLS